MPDLESIAARILGLPPGPPEHPDENEPLGRIAARILNYSPGQPRDRTGRWTAGGAGPMPPINIKPEQRARLTAEERDDWNKTWRKHDNAKKAARAETDPHKQAQLKAEEDRLFARLKEIRAKGEARLQAEGGGTKVKVGRKGAAGGKGAGRSKEGGSSKEGRSQGGPEQKAIDVGHEAAGLVGHIAEVGLVTGGLVHLGDLRHAMRHLSPEQFNSVVDHARTNGSITLSGAEGRHGLTGRDKASAIYEKDPLGGPDKMLLYASLKSDTGAGSAHTTKGAVGSVVSKSRVSGTLSHPNPQNIHEALDNAFDAGQAVFGKHAFARSQSRSQDLKERLYALGSADVNSFDHIIADPHLRAKAEQEVKDNGAPSGFFHNEYFRKLVPILDTFERGPKDARHKQSMIDKLDALGQRIKTEAIPALDGTNQADKADYYATHASVVIHHLKEYIKSSGAVGGQVSLDHILERVKATGAARGVFGARSAHTEAVVGMMDEHSGVSGDVQAHGMAKPEAARGMVVDGVQFHWTEATKGAAAESLIALAHDRLAPALWDATHRVIFSPARNKDDHVWEQRYGIKDFKSHATGGDGTVVVYNGEPTDRDNFAHESGHNLATKVWGNTTPPVWKEPSAYAQAQKAEKPVTDYGKSSPSEDFAEAVRLYSSPVGHGRLQRGFPKKYAALKELLGAWDPRAQRGG